MTPKTDYVIPIHGSLAEPLTIAGVPRPVAIANATFAAVLCFGLQAPWFGVPICTVIHGLALWITAEDPYAFQAMKRHLLHGSFLDA